MIYGIFAVVMIGGYQYFVRRGEKRGYRGCFNQNQVSSEADCEYPLDPNGDCKYPPDPGSDRVKYK